MSDEPIATIRSYFSQVRSVPLTSYQSHFRPRGWTIVIDGGAADVDHDVLFQAVMDQTDFLASRSDQEIETWLDDTYIDYLRGLLFIEHRRRVRGELQRRRDAWMTKYRQKWNSRADEIWAAGHPSAHEYLTSCPSDEEAEFDLIAAALRDTESESEC